MNILAKDEVNEETYALANEIREMLDADVWEEAKGRMIYQRHRDISAEQYLDVWTILDSRTRSAWKAYCRQGEIWTQ